MAKRLIGEGSFGQVFCKDNVATKLIPVRVEKHSDNWENVQSIIRELHCLVLGRQNPYIVQIINAEYNRYNQVEINMEKMSMDLGKFLTQSIVYSSPLHEDLMETIVNSITHGLYFLHSHDIMHRDLKPANVMIDVVKGNGNEYRVKLCDFGMSRRGGDKWEGGSDYVVTRWYRAPEIFRKDAYNTAIDMWALGAIIAECQDVPHTPIFRVNYFSEVRAYWKNLLDRELPETKYTTMLKGCLEWSPDNRWTAKKCLQFLKEDIPEYSKSYVFGNTIDESRSIEMIRDAIEEYTEQKNAIMHGVMLFDRTLNRSTRDFHNAMSVSSIIWESMPDNEFFRVQAEETNMEDICKFAVENCMTSNLSEYEYGTNIDAILKDMEDWQVVVPKHKKMKC